MSTASIGVFLGGQIAKHPAIGSPVIGAGIGGFAGAKAGHYLAEHSGVPDEDNHGGLIGGIIGGAIGGGFGGSITTGMPGGICGTIGGAVLGGVIGHQVDKGRL